MKQIIPFKKELPFKTKVSEITSISLERELTVEEEGIITGIFHITGDYKMNEGSINRENFSFDLPFDITLDPRYDITTVTSDIEDFYYDVINEDTLKVNIDLYVEAEYLKESQSPSQISEKESQEESERESDEPEKIDIVEVLEEPSEDIKISETDEEREEDPESPLEKVDSLTECAPDPLAEEEVESVYERVIKEEEKKPEITDEKEEKKLEITDKKEEREPIANITTDLFSNLDDTETYTTYYVYIVKEDDTIDKILTKYKVTKEDLEAYNDIAEIKPGDKIIVPKTSE